MNAPRFDRREGNNLQVYVALCALIVTLLLNVVGLAYGAARLSSSVDQLNETVRPLVTKVNVHDNDISLLKYQVNHMRGSE